MAPPTPKKECFLSEINKGIKRIEKLLEEKSGTTNTTRIGALNRISEAVKIINYMSISQGPIPTDYYRDNLKEIKEILLGTKGR